MSTPVSPASRWLAWRPRNLAGRMARWGVVIVIVYLLIALLTPLFTHLGLLPDVNAGLETPSMRRPRGSTGAAPIGSGATCAAARWPAVVWPCRWWRLPWCRP